MFLLAGALVGLSIVLYQQFIFHMAMRYTLSFWLSYTVLLSVMFFLTPVPLPLGVISLAAIAICLIEFGLIHVTRRLEETSERNPPGSGPLSGKDDSPEPKEQTWDRAG